VIAINELLLREGRKLAVGDLVDTLHVASNRERPAAAALALVLDRSHSTVLNPVLLLGVVRERLVGGRKERGTREVLGDLVKIDGSELLRRKISELIEAEARTVGDILEHLVHLENKGLVGGEHADAVLLLLIGGILGLVLSLPGFPLLIDGIDNSKS